MVTSIKIDIFCACHHEAHSTLRTVWMHPKLCWWVWHGHWAVLGDQQRDVNSPELSPQGVLHLYSHVHTNVYCYVPYGHLGEFSSAVKPIIFVIRRTLLVPGVCPCIRIRSMMHYVHTGEAVVTSIKIDIIWLVTTRPVAHSGRFGCIPNCVGEFGTDTGQPLVTSNVMSDHLSYHQKVYYTYIEMYIQMYNTMCHMDTWEKIHQQRNLSFFFNQKDRISCRSVSVHSY